MTAVLVGGWLLWSTTHDVVAHEQVVRAASPAGRVLLARGHFASLEHRTSGTASIVRVPGGRRLLTLTGFATSAGPDLRVRLRPGDVDLGGLKGNLGDQQYRLPAGTRVRGRAAVIWCRAFSAAFGRAELTRP